MIDYRIKTHQPGRTYKTPHFFILNKGLNSGRPMNVECPNCFVIETKKTSQKEALFYLCLALQIGRYFSIYIKGSVIQFISIKDAREVLNKALLNYIECQWDQRIIKLKKISEYENNLTQQMQMISQLKIAILRN